MSAASIFEFPNFYTDFPEEDIDTLSVIPQLVTRTIVAYNDSNLTNESLTIGATSNVVIEAQSNLDVYVGSNVGAFRLFETSVADGTRTDTQLLTVAGSAAGTTILAHAAPITLRGQDAAYTTTVGLSTLTGACNMQIFDTTEADGFKFLKNLQVQGTTIMTGNSITMGNIYGNNLNVWTDKASASNDRIGYGFRINNVDQLELVKHTRFLVEDGYKSVTKKIAVFGGNMLKNSDSSDTSYLIFDDLNGLGVGDTVNSNVSYSTGSGGTSADVTSNLINLDASVTSLTSNVDVLTTTVATQSNSLSNLTTAVNNKVSSQWTNNTSNIFFTADSNLSSGVVGIGFSNPTAYKFSVNGEISAASDVIAFSDSRVKTDLVKITNALDKVMNINGYTFKRTDMDDTGRRYAGVIAQEVQQVLPEVIHQNSDGFLSVAYGNIASLLIEAIKEMNIKIDKLVA